MELLLLVFVAPLAWFTRKGVRKVRSNERILWQFGKFTNTRPGIKDNANWSDEPDVVEYTDYKYWVRLRPNPGVNLPVFGYWSKARRRKGR